MEDRQSRLALWTVIGIRGRKSISRARLKTANKKEFRNLKDISKICSETHPKLLIDQPEKIINGQQDINGKEDSLRRKNLTQ